MSRNLSISLESNYNDESTIHRHNRILTQFLAIEYNFRYKYKLTIYILPDNKAKKCNKIEKSHILKIMIFLKIFIYLSNNYKR